MVSACGSYHGAVRIVSDPPGAQVVNLDNDSVVGITPLVLAYKSTNSNRQHIPVQLIKEGYYSKVTSFWLSMRHTTQNSAEKAPKVVEISLEKKGQLLSLEVTRRIVSAD